MAANFLAGFERPPRRPIRDRYLVTSEGTRSTYRKPLSSSSHTVPVEIFASHSRPIRWISIEGECRNTQGKLILDSLANSGTQTRDLQYPRDAEMSLSAPYCDIYLHFRRWFREEPGEQEPRSCRVLPKQRPSGTDGSPPPRECDGVARLRVVEELAPAIKLRLIQPALSRKSQFIRFSIFLNSARKPPAFTFTRVRIQAVRCTTETEGPIPSSGCVTSANTAGRATTSRVRDTVLGLSRAPRRRPPRNRRKQRRLLM